MKRKLGKKKKAAAEETTEAAAGKKKGLKGLSGKKKILFLLAVLLLVAGAAAAVLVVLHMKDAAPVEEEEEIEEPIPIEAPIQYALGEEVTFLALPVGDTVLTYEGEPVSLMEEAEAAKAAAEPPAEEETPAPSEEEENSEDGDDAEEEDESKDEEPPEEEAAPLIGYRYEGLSDPVAKVSAYASLLLTEDIGFFAVDETLREVEEELLYEGERGTVYLAQRLPKPEEGDRQAIALRMDWDESACEITAELVPASMTVRPTYNTSVGQGAVLTFTGAVETIKALSPSVLELPGDSMEDYHIYARDGLVLINDQSCMRIDIYRHDERVGTNIAEGNYFLSSDGQRLYLLDTKTNTVRELSMT